MDRRAARQNLGQILRLATLLTLTIVLGLPWIALSADQHTRFNIKDRDRGEAPKDSILDLTFGSPTKMATERGILVIDAFFDENGNLEHDPDEDVLSSDVQCKLDGINYTIPAFIPGLEYQETFELTCEGVRYFPQMTEDMVFIRKRGQVLQINLPCWLHEIPRGAISMAEKPVEESKQLSH